MRKKSFDPIEDYILSDEKIVFNRDITNMYPWIGDVFTAAMFFIIAIVQLVASIGVHAYILEFKAINMLLEVLLPIAGILLILDVATRRCRVIGTNNRIIFIRRSILKTVVRDVNYDSITGIHIYIRWRPLLFIGFILLFTYIGVSIFGPLFIVNMGFSGFFNGVILGIILGIIVAIVETPYSAMILYTPGTLLGRWSGEPLIIKLNPFQKIEKRLKLLQEIQQFYWKQREEQTQRDSLSHIL